MAKKDTQSGRGRLRVFFAEFEGSDETIQDSLKAVAAAVNRTFEPKAQITKYIQAATSQAEDVAPDVDGIAGDPEEDVDVSQVTNENSSKRRSRKSPTMSIVKTLDLMPSGKPSLRDFYAEKTPESQYSQIAVFLYYMQKILGLQGITANHVFTCYKDIPEKLTIPKDLPQSIRNAASAKGWVDSAEPKNLTVTSIGENHVEHDLPASEGQADDER